MDEQSIFLKALEQPDSTAQADWIEQACGEDESLKRRLTKMLEKHRQADDFLEQPAPEIAEKINAEKLTKLDASFADASFADGFGTESFSVLHSLSNSFSEFPRVSLRDSEAEFDEPVARPNSPEIPNTDPDSRYRLLGEIARGGMGVILKGRDNDLGRDLAVKVLLDSHKDRPDVIQRFIEEAQIGGQLQHPGIAPVYELGQFSDKRPFFSMKLIKGQTLAKLLSDRTNCSEDRARFLGIFEQICQTMAYAHSRGVIHRDLKPANIMVGAFGEVQVMDWGLAKVLSAGGVADEKKAHTEHQGKSVIQTLRTGVGSNSPAAVGSIGSDTQMGSVMGTPAYMSPEQALGEIDNLDERTDVFSLGAILCEMVTGKPPYVADHGKSVYRMAARANLAECLERLDDSGVDADLIQLTKHCLSPEPVERPRDASLVASRMSGYLESVETKLRESEKQRAVDLARVKEERKRRQVQLVFAVSVVALLILGSLGWWYLDYQADFEKLELTAQKQEEKNVAEATRLVEGLSKADTLQLKSIIESLADYRQYAKPLLKEAFDQTSTDSNAKLHVALAMLPFDESVLTFLKQRLLQVHPTQFRSVRDLLASYKKTFIPDYRELTIDEGENPRRRFWAAGALAGFDPTSELWQRKDLRQFVAEYLTRVRPSDFLPWTEVFRPVRNHLKDPLIVIFHDRNGGEKERLFAANTLADYLSADAEALFTLVLDADDKQFAPIFEKLANYPERAIKLSQDELRRKHPETRSASDTDAWQSRQASAMVLLVLLDAPDIPWNMLQQGPDPGIRSYIVHRLGPCGVDPEAIVNRFQQETDPSTKRALILGLGEIDDSGIRSSERQLWIDMLLKIYREEPDSGIHAATTWLLRKWGQEARVASINEELKQTEALLTSETSQQRQWYVNSQKQTMVIIDAGEFQMGSPLSEPRRNPFETLHPKNINRRYAMSSHEVTRQQWRTFYESVNRRVWSPDQDQLDHLIKTDDSPILGVSWYQAAQYCNWLSEHEGIAEDQWCYEVSPTGSFNSGMRGKEKFWELQGYRLATEAEWEYACRAGTTTRRYFGDMESLLPKYVWYQLNSNERVWPVGSLKPNDFGLFDMLGNAKEWVYDPFSNYPTNVDEAIEDTPDTKPAFGKGRRILRGGSFSDYPTANRSSRRAFLPPAGLPNGFRVVRTLKKNSR